jgi:hypothetical protein
MKLKFLFTIIFSTLNFLFCVSQNSQGFSVTVLIDESYSKTYLTNLLRRHKLVEYIGKDYFKIKFAGNKDNKVKYIHEDGGRVVNECEIFTNSNVICNPCIRFQKERNKLSKEKSKIYILTSDPDVITCDIDVEDYKSITNDENIGKLIDQNIKDFKKKKLDSLAIYFWFPVTSVNTVDMELINPADKEVEFGKEIQLKLFTNSKNNVSYNLKKNGELIRVNSEIDEDIIIKGTPEFIPVAIEENTVFSLEAKGCGVQKTIEVKMKNSCNSAEKVVINTLSSSLNGTHFFKKMTSSYDMIDYLEVFLTDNKYYFFPINKQCGVESYKVLLENVRDSTKYFTYELRLEERLADVYLSTNDKNKYVIGLLTHDRLKYDKVFEDDEEGNEPIYRLKIIPTKALRNSIKLEGYESESINVKFRKCN